METSGLGRMLNLERASGLRGVEDRKAPAQDIAPERPSPAQGVSDDGIRVTISAGADPASATDGPDATAHFTPTEPRAVSSPDTAERISPRTAQPGDGAHASDRSRRAADAYRRNDSPALGERIRIRA
jgi:hypothetical protein